MYSIYIYSIYIYIEREREQSISHREASSAPDPQGRALEVPGPGRRQGPHLRLPELNKTTADDMETKLVMNNVYYVMYVCVYICIYIYILFCTHILIYSVGPRRRQRPHLRPPRGVWEIIRATESMYGFVKRYIKNNTTALRSSEFESFSRSLRQALGRNHVGRCTCTGCTGMSVHVHGLHH